MSIAAFFAPTCVAIVGASNDPTRIGGRPLVALAGRWLHADPARRLFPVNPTRERVQDLPAFATMASLPQRPDLAIIAVPAAATLDAVRECAAAGCPAAIVFASGFAESGPEGGAAQRRLADAARARGMRLLGPNCLGVMVPASGMFATFSESASFDDHAHGVVAVASQSGAIMSQILMLARRRGLGLGALVSTGNESDVTVAECIDHFAADHATKVIVAYVESCRDGARLAAALANARAAGKPVIMLKVGRTAAGSEATKTHTGALAGEDRIYDAVFRQYGAWRATSFDEAIDIAYVCSNADAPAGNRLGVVTISGGAGALVADAATDDGLDVAPLPADAEASLRGMLPYATARNPLDTTAQILNDLALWTRSLAVVVGAGYDAVLMYLAFFGQSPRMFAPLLEAMGPLRRKGGPPLVFCSLFDPAAAVAARAAGFLVFEDPSRAVRALAGWTHIHKAIREARNRPIAAIDAGKLLPPGRGENEIKQALASAHIAVPEEHVVTTREAAVACASSIGFPVVMKVSSPDIAHKTEVGGVVLGVADEAEAARAWDAIASSVATKAPAARIEGVLVARQYIGGLEMLLGSIADPIFGTMILLGAGGILAEALDDVAMRQAPLCNDDADAMIDELRIARLLDGIRGGPALDRVALRAAVVEFAATAMAAGDGVSIEINPLLVQPEGQGCVALDALVVTNRQGGQLA